MTEDEARPSNGEETGHEENTNPIDEFRNTVWSIADSSLTRVLKRAWKEAPVPSIDRVLGLLRIDPDSDQGQDLQAKARRARSYIVLIHREGLSDEDARRRILEAESKEATVARAAAKTLRDARAARAAEREVVIETREAEIERGVTEAVEAAKQEANARAARAIAGAEAARMKQRVHESTRTPISTPQTTNETVTTTSEEQPGVSEDRLINPNTVVNTARRLLRAAAKNGKVIASAEDLAKIVLSALIKTHPNLTEAEILGILRPNPQENQAQ